MDIYPAVTQGRILPAMVLEDVESYRAVHAPIEVEDIPSTEADSSASEPSKAGSDKQL